MGNWKNVPFSTEVTLDRVRLKMLPTLIGENSSLDAQIAKILRSQTDDCWWQHGNQLFEYPAPADADMMEIILEGTSLGCFYPATQSILPEEEDERELVKATLTFYDDKENIIKDGIEIKDEKILSGFHDVFESKLYEADLPDGYDDPPEPDYPDDDY